MRKYKALKYAVLPLALMAGLTLSVSSVAGDKPKAEWKHSYCNQDGAQCGAIVYANGGGYVVEWAKVVAKEKKKQDAGYNSVCLGIEKKLDTNLSIGEFDLFVVPAICRYKVKINISGGEKRDRDVKITPACILVTYSEGTTTTGNKIKKKKRDFKFPDGMDEAMKQQLKALGQAECGISSR